MPGDAELLRAIHETPGDDGPRLVYADLLMERGDPRGEYIALSCAPDIDDDLLELRQRALWQHHRAAWLAVDRVGKRAHVEYARGLPSSLYIDAGELARDHATWPPHPFEDLALQGLTADAITTLTGIPLLSTVARLTLHAADLVPVAILLRFLDSLPRLSGLTLVVRDLRSRHVLDAVAQMQRATELRALSTVGLAWDSQRASWIARACTRLEELSIDTISGAVMDELTAHVATPLRVLDLNGFAVQAAARLGDVLASPLGRSLESLSLTAPMRDEGPIASVARALASLPPTVKKLAARTGHPMIGEAVADAHLPALEELSLRANDLEDYHVAPLAQIHTLRVLRLDVNQLSASAARDFAELPSLRELSLNQNAIGDDGVLAIADVAGDRLRALHLESAKLSGRSVTVLGRFTRLRRLTIAGNRDISEDHLSVLAHAPLALMQRLDVRDCARSDIQPIFAADWLPLRHDVFERKLDLAVIPTAHAHPRTVPPGGV